MFRLILFALAALLLTLVAPRAQEGNLKLAVSPVLKETGLLKYLLPRFSLKTGIRFDLVALPVEADLVLTSAKPDGSPLLVMQGLGQKFYVAAQRPDNKKSARFVDWLVSDVGQNTIDAFKQDGVQVFTAVADIQKAVIEVTFEGDIVAGKTLAYRNCGRCHVIGEANRMKGIGSTPSFALMRTFPDWPRRFQIYFTLNPHPSFTQIIGMTEPFDPTLPPPIVPLALTIDDLENILAFVATIKPADLGAPLQHQ